MKEINLLSASKISKCFIMFFLLVLFNGYKCHGSQSELDELLSLLDGDNDFKFDLKKTNNQILSQIPEEELEEIDPNLLEDNEIENIPEQITEDDQNNQVTDSSVSQENQDYQIQQENKENQEVKQLRDQIEVLKNSLKLVEEQNQYLKQQIENKNSQEAKSQEAKELIEKLASQKNQDYDTELQQVKDMVQSLKVEMDTNKQKEQENQAKISKQELSGDLQSDIEQAIKEKDNDIQDKASEVAQKILQSAQQEIDEEKKAQLLDKAENLLNNPQDRIQQLQQELNEKRDQEIKNLELNLLEKAEQEMDFDKKEKLLNEVRALEKNPEKVYEKVKDDFLEEELLRNIPKECRESVMSALQINELNKNVVLAQMPKKSMKKEVKEILDDHHMTEYLAQFFIEWLADQIEERNQSIEEKELEDFQPKIEIEESEEESRNSIQNLVQLIQDRLTLNKQLKLKIFQKIN